MAKKSKVPPDTRLDQVLPLVQGAKDEGITLKEIAATVFGEPKAPANLKAKLKALVAEGAIRAPLTCGTPKNEYYFAQGVGPTLDSVSAKIGRLVEEGGDTEPPSEKSLLRDMQGAEGFYFKRALQHAVDSNAIRGPYAKGKEKHYFPPGLEPSVGKASAAIARLVLEAGTTLLSQADLAMAITEFDAHYLDDALERNLRDKVLAEFMCGNAKASAAKTGKAKAGGAKSKSPDALKFYVHRDVAMKHFGVSAPRPGTVNDGEELPFDEFLSAYRRLKAAQRGISTVTILSLLESLDVSREVLHRFLLTESKAGRVTIHPDTTGGLSDAELQAGIRADGAEPYVAVVVKNP